MEIVLNTYLYKREEAIRLIVEYESQMKLLSEGLLLIELQAKIDILKEIFEIE